MADRLQRYVPAYDPDEEVAAAGVVVSYWAALPYLGLYARTDDGQGEIGLRADLAVPSHARLRRAVLAHELGHHHLHAGLYAGPVHCRRDDLTVSAIELQAERFAGERLISVALVRRALRAWGQLGTAEVADLADLARVPVEFAAWWVADLAGRGLFLPPSAR